MIREFYSNGKLLLTGEYAVLDGALSLAVPTSKGQSLKVTEIDAPLLLWKSRDEKGAVWFESVFELETLFAEQIASSGNSIAVTLIKILREAKKMNSSFLSEKRGCEVETILDFPRDWGLGSSSTLINNIAQWADIDAYDLLWNAFSGSGYDIACAQNDSPISYRLENGKPMVEQVDFNPPFLNTLYFIHLDKKQNSRKGIARYRAMNFDSRKLVKKIAAITENILLCSDLSHFEKLVSNHEHLISKALQLPTIKESVFPGYKGAIKSLGAWGGDFVMATGNEKTPKYFKDLGYETVIPYSEMILQKKH